MAQPAIKAIIFDCFGVLYLDAHESLSAEYPAVSQQLRDVNRQSDYGMIERADYIETVARLTGESPTAIEQFAQTEHRLNKHLIRYIQTKLRPHYKIGLLSNIGRDWINDFFDANQLHGLFDAVVVSSDEGITKPHPRIYEIISERLNIKPDECLMVDDLPDNCAGADAAGMAAIQYQDFTSFKRQLDSQLSRI